MKQKNKKGKTMNFKENLCSRRTAVWTIISTLLALPFVFHYMRKRRTMLVPDPLRRAAPGHVGGPKNVIIDGKSFDLAIPEMVVETQEDFQKLESSIKQQLLENPRFQEVIDADFERGKEETKAANLHLFEKKLQQKLEDIEEMSLKEHLTPEKRELLIRQAHEEVERQKQEVFRIIDETKAPPASSLL